MLSARNASFGTGRARAGTLEDHVPQSAPPVSRPPHVRSRSYLSGLSPTDLKPRNAVTLPIESSTLGSFGGEKPESAERATQRKSTTQSAVPVPKIHLNGLSNKTRKSQDARSGSIGPLAKEDGQDDTRESPQAQLQLQHLGLNMPVNVRRTHSHRHTRSELPRSSVGDDRTNNHDGLLHPSIALARGESMLTRMATNLSNLPKPHHQHSTSDFHRATNTNPMEAKLPGAKPSLRRRATSDPRAPQYARGYGGMAAAQAQFGLRPYMDVLPDRLSPDDPPMSEVDILFYKAEKAREDSNRNVKDADVQKLTTQLAESNVELQGQLSNIDRSARGLMRRLDYAHDNLIRTSSSLVDTISSFQNLCVQSDTLSKNFESRTDALNKEIRTALKKQKKALFDKRGNKITELEKRSRQANDRAEELSRRLDNCRVVIKNFTEREQTKRRAWKGVIVGSVWGCAIVLSSIFLGFAVWWLKSYGRLATHDVHSAIALILDNKGLGAMSDQITDTVKERAQEIDQYSLNGSSDVFEALPSHVKAVLDDIASRHDASESDRQAAKALPEQVEADQDDSLEDNNRLKRLFDKLEL